MTEHAKICRDCGLDPAVSSQERCGGCQHDYEIRLARKLARTPKEDDDAL